MLFWPGCQDLDAFDHVISVKKTNVKLFFCFFNHNYVIFTEEKTASGIWPPCAAEGRPMQLTVTMLVFWAFSRMFLCCPVLHASILNLFRLADMCDIPQSVPWSIFKFFKCFFFSMCVIICSSTFSMFSLTIADALLFLSVCSLWSPFSLKNLTILWLGVFEVSVNMPSLSPGKRKNGITHSSFQHPPDVWASFWH